MNRLDGKVAFLSGAARGIGGETAKLMASVGAKVAIGDVLDERGRQTAKEIEAAGGQALYVSLDVTQEASWAAAIDATVKKFGKLDVLVNNAGVLNGKGIEEASLDEWNKLVAVNLTGVVLGTRAALPHLKARGQQTFVTRARAQGTNDTEATRKISIGMHPIGRLGVAEDIAKGIVFLASDDAAFMTGSGLVVDGGYTAQ